MLVMCIYRRLCPMMNRSLITTWRLTWMCGHAKSRVDGLSSAARRSSPTSPTPRGALKRALISHHPVIQITSRHSVGPASSTMTRALAAWSLCILLAISSLRSGAAASGIFESDKPSSGKFARHIFKLNPGTGALDCLQVPN